MENDKQKVDINLNDFKDFNKILKEFNNSPIKMKSPTQKVNLNKDDKFHVVGMKLLLSYENIKTVMNADLDDLQDDTILFINSHHIVESIMIIDGALYLLANNGKMTFEQRDASIDLLCNLLGNGIIRYNKLQSAIKEFINSLNIIPTDNVTKDILYCLEYIALNIWFLPYNEIDNIINTFIEEFKKDMEENDAE